MKKIINKTKWIKLSFPALIFLISLLITPALVMAGSENDVLMDRIEKLEKELNELKVLVKAKITSTENIVVSKPSSVAKKPSEGFSIKPYGYVKLDASYDDSAVTNGNFVIRVPSEDSVKNDDEFNMTARQTRLGMVVTALEYNGWSTTGKVEIDFYGNGPAVHEDKAEPVMRHAYVEIKKENISYIAGQTWDVISPLNPTTLNNIVGWSAGNIGYRRPQLRASYNTSLNNDTSILTQFALSRTSGLAGEDFDGDAQNDGEDSGIPTIQGRMALTTKGLAGKKATIGISGHYGQEEVEWEGAEKDLASWSGNMDFNIPLTDRFTVKGEVFVGENMDDYFGGVLQGVNKDTGNEISSTGMWSQLNFAANKDLQYNIGFGFDNPDSDDINDGMRDKNSFYYINTLFKVLPKVTLGFEYSYWDTEYKNLADGTDNRFQTSVIFAW